MLLTSVLTLLLVGEASSAWSDPRLAREASRRASVVTGPLVREVSFVGNDTFDDETLAQYMQTRASGFLHKYYYDRRAFIRDVQNLQRFYVAQGFLEAEVELDDIALSADSTQVDVLVGVYEGDRWMVESVTFTGNSEISMEELVRPVTLDEGEPFVVGSLARDKQAVLEEYASRSYLDARVTQTVERDDERRTASIAYDIVERERATIASIDVVGDEKTRQFVIERELTFEAGEHFDFLKIGESQANIYRTGLFNSVWIEPSPADTGKAEKRVIVRVGERPSGDLDFTLSYAAIDGVEAGAAVTNRNVQGQATTLGMEGRYSERAREARASVGDPWFLGYHLAVETAGSYEWRDEESFLAETAGGSFVLSRDLGLNLTVEGGYQYERTIVLEAAEGDDELGKNYTSNLLLAGIYDSRDGVLNARRGMYARVEVDFASSRLGGTNDFARYELDWRGYRKVGHGRVVALEVRGGWINPQGEGDSVPVNERYFAGGESTVRGFARNSLGPVGDDDEPKGGRALAVVRAEVRFPVYKNLRGAVFSDAAQVFDDLVSTDLSDLAVGAGLGLRFDTRLGVLRLDAAVPVSESGTAQFYFGVGQAF